MKALKKFYHKGRAYDIGDEVTATDESLKRLVYFGLVKEEKKPKKTKEEKFNDLKTK